MEKCLGSFILTTEANFGEYIVFHVMIDLELNQDSIDPGGRKKRLSLGAVQPD